MSPFNFGFRKLHSTETALVKVVNDLLLASDSGTLSILILLDLSSAFDTVDHMLLLNRLKTVFGVSGTALEWFRLYFTGRTQFVFMDGFRSDVDPVCTGVTQGSVLGPLLFSIYIYPLGQLLRSLNLSYHFYADDTQIYIHSQPGQCVDVPHLSSCISEIKMWMAKNVLCLNSSKTEVMLLGSPHQLRNAASIDLSVDGAALELHSKLKNLGVIFDATLSFEPFVQNTVKTTFFHLRNIVRIRPMLSFSVAEKLINSFVFSRIDYCTPCWSVQILS